MRKWLALAFTAVVTFTGCKKELVAKPKPPRTEARKPAPAQQVVQVDEERNIAPDKEEEKVEQPPIKTPKKHSFVELEKARAINDYLKSLDASRLDLKLGLKDCVKENKSVSFGGKKFQISKEGIVEDDAKIFFARKLATDDQLRAVRLQEKLLEYVPGIREVRKPRFLRVSKDCNENIVFEEGKDLTLYRISEKSKEGFLAAANALSILKSLHSVGIVHRRIKSGFKWIPNHIESLKLDNFESAESSEEKSVAEDLTAFAAVFLEFFDEREAFLQAAREQAFDFDRWITSLRAAAESAPN